MVKKMFWETLEKTVIENIKEISREKEKIVIGTIKENILGDIRENYNREY